MKQLGILTCFILFSIGLFAQHGPRERIRAFKIAYITEKLDLSSKEAQEFWPIYNSLDRKLEEFKRKERKLIRAIKEVMDNPNGLSDQQAGNFIEDHIKIKEDKAQAQKELVLKLKSVLPNKKILKLIKAEADFKKRMLDRMRERRKRH